MRRAKLVRSPPTHELGSNYRKWRKLDGARRDYSNEVNDPALRPKPTGKRPKRNEKRRPSKPGRR